MDILVKCLKWQLVRVSDHTECISHVQSVSFIFLSVTAPG